MSIKAGYKSGPQSTSNSNRHQHSRWPAKTPAEPASQTQDSPRLLEDIPPDLYDIWDEGYRFLLESPESIDLIDRLDNWKGLPRYTMRWMHFRGLVSMPDFPDGPSLALRIDGPDWDGNQTLRGFTALHYNNGNEDTRSWHYWPAGVPHLPFIINACDDCFTKAKRVVVLRGQWDALAFAGATGWMDSGWPEDASVIGVSDPTAYRTFLYWWREFWPTDCRFLLIGDISNPAWRALAAELKQPRLSASVQVRDTGKGKDFADLHKLHRFTPTDIAALIQASEKGVAK